ncbi:MAG TPA: multicopper oxidase family protein [Nocardioidaceae bacterium]|nr:multicopper oxidase family protein [Nocardioidaceae bacterium]
MTKARLGVLAACLATTAIVLTLGWAWHTSRMPATYAVTDMGRPDYGGGPRDAGHHGSSAGHAGTSPGRSEVVSVRDLVEARSTPADVTVDLVAAKQRFRLASGRTVDGYTLNGSSPGPLIEARQGDLVEVRVRNESVPDGITLHWHGVDVPNAEDGVAGVTQDAVGEGEEHTYRFVADDAGTYWYHSHQVSHRQVVRGLFGALVVHPTRHSLGEGDVLAVTHQYGGVRTLNGREGDVPVVAPPGRRVRVRVVNTDNAAVHVWSGGDFRVLAVDGTEVTGPTPVQQRYLTLAAGGRADLEVRVPRDGSAARVQVERSTALLVGPRGSSAAPAPRPPGELDLLGYGSRGDLGFDPARADRRFDYRIGRRPGFVAGRPGVWWSINGRLWPDVPMYVVEKGDVVVMRIENGSGEAHPMHLHGHHAVVLSRNGVAASGAPWWVDSLHVRNGETFEVALVADNPGVWMDHCHNLQHARDGLVAHLMYAGVSTPYRVGGEARNEPE